ncbi:MAG TPA: hypothetical protein VFG87_21835 [Amycolatopsis sp.]|nr:hypothetical protein [Amycolatopsis sp.]
MDGARLRDLISDLLSILRTGDHDILWTRYDSVEDVITELEQLRDRIKDGDPDARQRLRFLCLPTGAIDEIAISSGWAGAWVELIDGKYRSVFA